MSDRPRVLSLESRRASEMETLIRKFGGEPTVAPSMREVPLSDNSEAAAAGEDLIARRFGAVVFLTGVGASAWMDVLEPAHGRDVVLASLRATTVCVRGPKPAALMKKWDVPIAYRAPEPNEWSDLVDTLDGKHGQPALDLRGQRVAVQEYGSANLRLHDALRDRGAEVVSVPVYRWAMPEDLRPLEDAVRGVCDGRFDVLLVTSAQQIRHAVETAGRLGVREAFEEGVGGVKVASIGPTATAAMREEFSFRVDIEPDHPKMGPLVRASLLAEPCPPAE